MRKRFNILLAVSIFLLNLIITKDPELENRAKLVACLNLTRARMTQDRTTIEALIGHEHGTDEEKNGFLNKIMIITLNYCFKKISIQSAGEILQKKSMQDIDSLSHESRDLLNIENWEEEFRSRDPEELEGEIRDIQNRLEDLNKRSNENPEQRYNQENEEENQYQDIPVDRNKKQSFTLLGIDISELPNDVKNIIGFSLLGLVFVVFIYGVRRVLKEMERPVKEKKRKNKQN